MARRLMLVDIDKLERLVIESGLTAKFVFAILECVRHQSECAEVGAQPLTQGQEVHG
jgi:hypothetical protein